MVYFTGDIHGDYSPLVDFYNRMTICFVMRIAMFFLPGIRPENEKRS